jgi:hypothetical protein
VSFVSAVPQDQREEGYFAPLMADRGPVTELNALVPYHTRRAGWGTTGDQVRLIDAALAASPGCGTGVSAPNAGWAG